MRKQLQTDTVKLSSATSTTPIADLDNIYLESLLWLTPTNPFLDPNGTTNVTFAFGGSDTYIIHDPESMVDTLPSTSWNTSFVAPTNVTLPNGDRIALPSGLTGEQAAIYVALQTWVAPTNIHLSAAKSFDTATFKFLATDEAGMQQFWSGERGVLGFSELPNDYGPNYGYYAPKQQPYSPGYAVFNQEGYGWTANALKPGGYGYVTVLHEIGHLFGLDHPWDEGGVYWEGGVQYPEPGFPGATSAKSGVNGLNQGVFTTMTYNDGWSGQPSKSADWGYQIGPGAFDIAAMQKLYGANTSYHADSDTYTLPGKNVSGTGWFTLWDADGNDTIQVPTGAGSANIDLRAATLEEGDPGAGGYVSWVSGIFGGFTIANGVVIENAVGGVGNDKLIGNAAANKLTGGGGQDILTGGDGRDIFIFANLSDSAAGAKRDTITDFTRGIDQIDLHGIDADTKAAGDQAFHWIDGASFTGTPGDLRFSNSILAGDVNGDRKADFEIALSGVTKMVWDDLIA